MTERNSLHELLELEDRPWAAYAACRDMDATLFFPEPEADGSAAKRVCAGCSVQGDCLQFALDARAQYGVWGGTTPQERRRIKRRIA